MQKPEVRSPGRPAGREPSRHNGARAVPGPATLQPVVRRPGWRSASLKTLPQFCTGRCVQGPSEPSSGSALLAESGREETRLPVPRVHARGLSQAEAAHLRPPPRPGHMSWWKLGF